MFPLPKQLENTRAAWAPPLGGPIGRDEGYVGHWTIDVLHDRFVSPTPSGLDREAWTATYGVRNVAGSMGGPPPRLQIARRWPRGEWRDVANGSAFFQLLEVLELPSGSLLVVGAAAREGGDVDYALVHPEAAKASAPRLLKTGVTAHAVRVAQAADGTLAVAWIAPLGPTSSASSVGAALWLERRDATFGRALGPAVRVDVDAALDSSAVLPALSADGAGVAIAWMKYSRKARIDADDRPMELVVYRQVAARDVPRRAWSTEVPSRAVHMPYGGLAAPLGVDVTTLDGHAVFHWFESSPADRQRLVLADGSSPLEFQRSGPVTSSLVGLAPDDARELGWNQATNTLESVRLRCR